VREVESRHVHPREAHFCECFFVVARRSDRAYYLCFAHFGFLYLNTKNLYPTSDPNSRSLYIISQNEAKINVFKPKKYLAQGFHGRMLGGDLSQGSLREGAPQSGGGDCAKSGSDLFAEPSNLFVHALSLSRLRDSFLRREPFCFFEPYKKERERMCGDNRYFGRFLKRPYGF